MIKRFLIAFFIFIALVTAACVYLLDTTAGLHITLDLVKKFIPGNLTIENAQGRLIGPLMLNNVTYTDSDIHISVKSFSLNWKPGDLLQNKLHIIDLSINNANVQLNKVRKSETSRSSLFLPSHLIIQQLHITKSQFSTSPNATPIVIQSFTLQYRHNAIKSLNAKITAGKATFTAIGALSKRWDFKWQADVPNMIRSKGTITGAANNPQITATASIERQNLTTNIDINANLHTAINKPITGKITTQIKHTVIRYKYQDQIKHIQLTSGTIVSDLSAHHFNSQLSFIIDKFGEIGGHINLPNVKLNNLSMKQSIKGQLSWRSNNLNLLQTFLPQAERIHGQLNASASIKGTIEKPSITFSGTLSQGQVFIPQLNLTLNQIQLTVRTDNHDLHYSGSVNSGAGKLSLIGETKLNQSGFPSEMTLKGNNLLVANTDETKVFASPDLNIKYQNNTLDINGSVFIPTANINIQNYSDTETLPEGDIVFVNQPKKEIKRQLQIRSHVTVVIGNKVNIAYQGVKGELKGKVTIQDKPSTPTTATGQLRLVNAKYKAYGQELTIKQGNLNFAGGPIDNPSITLRASRTIQTATSTGPLSFSGETIEVGVSVVGNIKTPKITLFSSPAGISQADILSYLVLGQPLSTIKWNGYKDDKTKKDDETKLLLSAATALNLTGGGALGHVTDKIKSTLGLSEFGLENQQMTKGDQTLQNTALVLGKFLSPRLYVSYSIGLFEKVNTFRARYNFNKQLSIQTETSSQGNGVDLLYSIER